MTTLITHEKYKAAADRIRKGCERDGDAAICDAYDEQRVASGRQLMRTIMDLPMAADMWRADARDLEEAS